MVDVPIPATRPSFGDKAYQSPIFFGDRAELPPHLKSQRRIALDFNAGGGRGVEIIIPNNPTEAELAASQAYVQGVKELMEKYGYENYPIRTSTYKPGVKRVGMENKSGIKNTFHTEPFFAEDKQAVDIFMDPAFQGEYATLLDSTLRQIPGSVTIAPHGVGRDKGASFTRNGETHTENSLGFAILAQLNGGSASPMELMPDTTGEKSYSRELMPDIIDGEIEYTREYVGNQPSQRTAEPQYEDRVLVDIPHEEVTGPGNFANLALGEAVDLSEPTDPEDYVLDLDLTDSFEHTVALMPRLSGFDEVRRLLMQPPVKIEYVN